MDIVPLVKEVMDNAEYNLFNLKELDYASKIISAYGCLVEEGDKISRHINSSSKKNTLDAPKYLIITLYIDTL